jgi:hypothetical protein
LEATKEFCAKKIFSLSPADCFDLPEAAPSFDLADNYNASQRFYHAIKLQSFIQLPNFVPSLNVCAIIRSVAVRTLSLFVDIIECCGANCGDNRHSRSSIDESSI